MIQTFIDYCFAHQLTFATCESMSGGDLASMITDVPSVSSVYLGGYVVYSEYAKKKMLDIDDDFLHQYGTVSQKTASMLAMKTKIQLTSDVAIAIVGNAGPTASSNQPVGQVYISIVYKNQLIERDFHFTGSRSEIKHQTCVQAVQILLDIIHE